ncbi:MAG: methyltransferase domain-containing protein [Anaerolineaceae bacterium]|nr:methyltransferase domain-containing protein [Anaerolineaceae bacterium]
MTDYFDQQAAGWDADPVKIERARAVAQAVRDNVILAPNMTALEYGCGTGLLSFALQPFLGQITLADNSSGMLAVLDEKIASSGFSNMVSMKVDFSTDPLPQARYQLIYSQMTLHHIPDTDKILQDFFTLLETSGCLCVADLDKEDGSFHDADFSGHHGFDRQELSEKVLKAGFRKVEFKPVFQMPKTIGASKKYFPVFLMIAEK